MINSISPANYNFSLQRANFSANKQVNFGTSYQIPVNSLSKEKVNALMAAIRGFESVTHSPLLVRETRGQDGGSVLHVISTVELGDYQSKALFDAINTHPIVRMSKLVVSYLDARTSADFLARKSEILRNTIGVKGYR